MKKRIIQSLLAIVCCVTVAFYDTLSEEEKETVRKRMRAKYKGNIVGAPKIDDFLEELERDYGIRLKRLPVTSVVAV